MSFSNTVGRFKRAIMRRKNSQTTVSPLDVTNVAPEVTGNVRGAAVRIAFDQLLVQERLSHHDTVRNEQRRWVRRFRFND